MLIKERTVSSFGIFVAVVMLSLLAMAGPPDASAWTITVEQSTGGKITPGPLSGSGPVTVSEIPNKNLKQFSIKCNSHYQVTQILVNGEPVIEGDPNLVQVVANKVYKYTFRDVIADGNTITATFAIDTFTVTVDKATLSSGTGTVTGPTGNGDGINCGSDCGESYDYGTAVTLTADADDDSVFEGWSGACKGKNLTCTTTVKKAGTAVAKFTKTYTLSVTITGTGTVTAPKGLNSGINCTTGTCTEVYKDQKVVTLVAKPGAGIVFSGWAVDATGTAKSVRVTMADTDKSVTAAFGYTGEGLKIAEKVSVVDTNSGTGMKPLTFRRYGAPEFAEDSDYNTDPSFAFVNERSAETFKTVNEILCQIAQTKYDEMLNRGNYKAQIDKNLCNSNQDDPSSAGESSQNQSSGSTAPNYEMWTVNSSRASDNAPQIVKVWIHEKSNGKGPEPDKIIFAKAEITEASSDANPYGLFTIYFKAVPQKPDGTPGNTVMFRGLLKSVLDPATGKVQLKFANDCDLTVKDPETQEDVDISFLEQATLGRDPDGSTGGGTAHLEEHDFNQPINETFDFAFNLTHFKRVDPLNPEETEMCLSRTEFDETVWRYGLYDADGARVNVNSGFPVKVRQNNKDYFGWIGYYGMWFPRDVSLVSGDTVNKMDFGPGSGDGTPYTLFISQGKLKKHTRKLLTLGEIKNVPLDYWQCNQPGQPCVGYRLVWNGTDFVKMEMMNQSSNIWEKLDPQVPLDITNLNFDMISFWSQALGGNVQIKLDCTMDQPPPWNPGDPPPPPPTFHCTASDDLQVVFYAETILYPTDTIPANLACFNNCPDLDKIASGDPNPYSHANDNQPQEVPPVEATYIAYTFDTESFLLKSSGSSVVLTGDSYQFGINSGPLFEPTADNLNYLACNWDETKTCGWQAWNSLPEFYTWETGTNDWNKFTALKDPADGTFLTFDPPMRARYVHTWPDASTSTFSLEYSGFGNLWGIPGKCIAWGSEEEVPCGPETRWVPQFSVPEGSEVTQESDGATKYYVKHLEKEQRMREVDISECSGLVTETYTLPDMGEWTDPNIGPEPTVDGAPAVIGGVVQQ